MRIHTKLLSAILAVSLWGIAGQAFSATTDVIAAPTGYFTPDESSTYSSPYYRWAGDDWGWTHNAITETITTATLSISAWDVDAPYEVDTIYAWSDQDSAYIELGVLQGADDEWGYTTFDLDASWFDEIANGLQVWMEIDTNNGGWAVSLAKSVLSVNGGSVPNPNPNPVPVPAAVWLFGSGLLGLLGFRRKRAAA
jgi:hypothetical protein